MKVLSTDLQDAKLVELRSLKDDRGAFFEAWNQSKYEALELNLSVVQSNVSVSHRGVLRGMHAQCPGPQGKLMTVLHGRIWDAIVDARPGSPTFMKWQGFELTSENHRQLWVPPGFLHGFLALVDGSVVNYLVTAPYEPGGDFSVAWNDPDLGIAWPLEELGKPLTSAKDAAAPFFRDLSPDRLVSFRK